MTENKDIVPFLKWAGGKRWLTYKLDSLCVLPVYNRYIEPFLGSGAMFFRHRPSSSIISDTNSDLVKTYIAIKDDWKKVESLLKTYHKLHNVEFYYKVRDSKPRSLHAIAAKFIYLNRTCFNGLYRVNKKGKFNVPIGSKKNVIMDTDDFSQISKMLNKSKIIHCDFEKSINMANKKDFIFADPPYTVKHENNGFVKYNERLFSWDDQIRLKDALVRASRRGAYIMVTNACHKSIKELYPKSDFILKTVERKSVIAASKFERGKYKEYLITNF